MNISDWIEHWASTTPQKVAIVFADSEVDYDRFNVQVRRYATTLQTIYNIEPGDRIAYLGLNSPEFLYLLFATARIGAIFVPLNWRLTPHELDALVHDARPSLLFADAAMADVGAQLKNQDCTPVPLQFDSTEAPESVVTPKYDSAIGDSMPALLIYTSGTTGKPKGALISHTAMLANAENSKIMHALTLEDNALISLPFFHVGGLNILTTPSFFVGATVTLHRKFDPQAMLDAMLGNGPTRVAIVSAQMPPIMALPDWEEAQFPQIQTVTTGASPVPAAVFSSWREKNVVVLQVYGATETCPIAICTSVDNKAPDDASTGQAAALCRVKVIDDSGASVSDGQCGEILVCGDNVMNGYWENEIASQETIVDGWFSTGDIGYRDSAGFYYIVDRKKDLIISGGENIFPAEIESLLIEHPAVIEAAVIARSDERWGEVPVAVVRLHPNAAFEHADTLTSLEGRLGRYKIPKETIVVDDFPRNSVGKIQKFALQEKLFTV